MGKYKNHPSILTIQNNVTIDQSFSFKMASTIYKQMNLFDSKKKSTQDGILPICLKLAVSESAPILTNIWNEEVVSSVMFPDH